MKKVYLLVVLLCAETAINTQNFNDHWSDMQSVYENLLQGFNVYNNPDKGYVFAYWQSLRNKIERVLRAAPRGNENNFLTVLPIDGQMIRSGFGKAQEYEASFLKHCVSPSTKDILKKFSETSLGGLPFDCKDFNCSINTLGQLFYAGRIIDTHPVGTLNTIFELGGGYGCLARIFLQVLPNITYVIFDLPEYLAVQHLYLQTSLPDVKLYAHNEMPEKLHPGIHLIPVSMIEQFNHKTDVFVSAFAVSESTKELQVAVAKKAFFDATTSYIMGQLNGWGSQFNFVNHQFVMQELRKNYTFSYSQPFHNFTSGLQNYEIYGTSRLHS